LVFENLAIQEQNIHQGESSSIDLFQTQQEVLNIETQSFLSEIYFQFEYLVRLFNNRKGNTSAEICLKKKKEIPEEGFSIERNHLSLSFQKVQVGALAFECAQKDGEHGVLFSGRVEANFGSFHDVEWFYIGSRVTSEQIARHYLTEFIQMSRR
jgi:hypothetical protein